MTRLEKLRELRQRIDQEIAIEVRCQKRLGKIEAEAIEVQSSPEQTTDSLIVAAADYYGVSVRTMLSERRTKKATAARMVAIWAIRTRLGTSYPELGRRFGRDHTTAINAVKRVDGDARLRTVGARLLRGLNEEAA